MNANRLLGNFDKIFGAPHAIPRLRRFMLELAVRGKLVDQDPKDEPASELLKQIAAEKPRLVRTKAIKARRASGIEVHTLARLSSFKLQTDDIVGGGEMGPFLSTCRPDGVLSGSNKYWSRYKLDLWKLTPPERLPVRWCSRSQPCLDTE